MQNYTFRLKPGQDLFESIEAFAMEKQVKLGCLLGGVGSLARLRLRLADRYLYSD